jgi:hypothetical protein
MILAQFLRGITMLNAFNVRWLVSDETKIKYTDEFESTNYVLKIDILEDAIAMLQQKHDELMSQEAILWEVRRKERANATI